MRAGEARIGSSSRQELRDLWLGGRGLVLGFAFSLLLSVIAYLVATNRALNFLEQREAVNLTLQVAVAVGALLTLLVAADAVSGERERGTLESLLLTPVSRRGSSPASSSPRSRSGSRHSCSRAVRLVPRPRRRGRRRRACDRALVGTLLAGPSPGSDSSSASSRLEPGRACR